MKDRDHLTAQSVPAPWHPIPLPKFSFAAQTYPGLQHGGWVCSSQWHPVEGSPTLLPGFGMLRSVGCPPLQLPRHQEAGGKGWRSSRKAKEKKCCTWLCQRKELSSPGLQPKASPFMPHSHSSVLCFKLNLMHQKINWKKYLNISTHLHVIPKKNKKDRLWFT